MAARGLPKYYAIDLKKAFWHKDKDVKRKALWSELPKINQDVGAGAKGGRRKDR
jgi:hypothetical protein